ncbi:MAG: helix-turn-helix transcriptional regulator [Lachnospiraceae bacterium]|nr:helix-turn-helix transcriptional regulator [Lachnospiraceae bacterium]
MDERIKELRKKLGLTQQEFADKLNIKRGAIANYEVGRNEPIDAVISLICREFNVNEQWLRDGDGEMFVRTTPYEKAYNRFGYIMENSIPSKKAALSAILELLYTVPDEQWKLIVKQYEDVMKEAKEKEES